MQGWVANNDPSFNPDSTAFLRCDAKHVDAAYEFIFSQIAGERISNAANAFAANSFPGIKELRVGKRMYITMPDFVSTSATSFEKFSYEVSNIINTVEGLDDHLSVGTFHPEHILPERRAPVATFVLQVSHHQTSCLPVFVLHSKY